MILSPYKYIQRRGCKEDYQQNFVTFMENYGSHRQIEAEGLKM